VATAAAQRISMLTLVAAECWLRCRRASTSTVLLIALLGVSATVAVSQLLASTPPAVVGKAKTPTARADKLCRHRQHTTSGRVRPVLPGPCAAYSHPACVHVVALQIAVPALSRRTTCPQR